MSEDRICEAFHLIAQYAQRQGWIPIGWKDFRVGPWRVRVNGTKQEREGVDPYHALIEHQDIVALMVIHPHGGTVGGWPHAERDFCEAMKQELVGASAHAAGGRT